MTGSTVELRITIPCNDWRTPEQVLRDALHQLGEHVALDNVECYIDGEPADKEGKRE